MNISRLNSCGWKSFRPELFLNEPGRKSRDLGNAFLKILQEFCRGKYVLELCCGSGRLLIYLAKNGYKVAGLDLSEEMLAICKKEVLRESKSIQDRIRLIQGDMCTFDLGQKFDFIILEDDGFMFLLTQEDQIYCLTRVSKHLSDGGYFFLSFSTPESELTASRDYEYDPISQIKTIVKRWSFLDEKGNNSFIEEGFERRKLTYFCEFELLLKVSGLEAIHRWGDLKRNPFLKPLTHEYNYLIRKAL